MSHLKTIGLFLALSSVLWQGKAMGQKESDTLTLQQCLGRAERLNPDLVFQSAKVAEAENKVKQQLGGLLPQLDASLSYTRYHEQLPSKRALFGPSLDDYYAEVGLRQILFDGGKNYYSWRGAQAALSVERSRLNAVRLQVLTSVRKTYYDLSRTVMSAAVQRELVSKLREQYAVAELLYAGGKTSNVDVLRVETQLEAQRDNLENLEQLAYARALGLGQTLGLDRPVWPKDELAEPAVLVKPKGRCAASGFQENPELDVVRKGIEKGRQEKSSARGELMPSVTMRLNYNREDRELFPNHPNWQAGVTVSVPLFKGGATLAQIRQADNRITQAEQMYRKTKLAISLRFQTSRAAYLDKLNRLKTIHRLVELSRQSLLAAEVRYGGGKLSTMELFDSQLAWSNAELNYTNTLTELLTTAAELEGICPGVFDEETK